MAAVLALSMLVLGGCGPRAFRAPLQSAVRANDRAQLERLRLEGQDLNGLDQDGSVLCVAAQDANVGMIEYLLEAGADPNLGNPDGYTSRSPLHSAAAVGCVECARLLLDRGASMSTLNREGQTPAALARERGYPGFADFLAHQGAAAPALPAPVASRVQALLRSPPAPQPTPSTVVEPAPAVQPSRRAKGEVIAVFDLEDLRKTLGAGDAEQLTEYFAVQLSAVGYKVVPRSQLRERLAAEKEQSYSACYDEACQIDLGKAVAAQKSVATKLLKVGSSCAITATLYDLRSETTELAASVDTRCEQEELFSGLRALARQLIAGS